jgi:lysophospholipase L1-like esterase
MREETREHQTVDTFALLPPSRDHHLRLRGGNYSPGLPTVFIDHHNDKSRKSRWACFKRFLKPILVILGGLLLVDIVSDYFFVGSNPAPPIIQRDYSQINSIQDLQSGDVEPKCFHKQSTCKCLNPIEPADHLDNPQWARVHHFNKENAQARLDADVVFFGDSITEAWLGTSWGRINAKVHSVPQVFESYFSVEQGGEFEGLALGIAGDLSPNLLWRIQNGELPDALEPQVIWLLIGTNDFGNTWCSAETVLIGIIRVVEELLQRKPAATIVVNGILPRTYNRQGFVARGRSRKWWKSRAPPSMPSLWDDIEAVNEELKNYASSREKVEYFETRAFFVDRLAPEENLQLDGKLMPDFLHPSAEGYRLWGQEIVDKLKMIMSKQDLD